MRTWPVTLLVSLGLAACGSRAKAPPPAPAGGATTAAGGGDTGAAARIAGTGAISEEEFKAMHDLRDDAAPPARGQMIELAGGRAYLSLPPGATAPVPGVVVIHEWWGLNEHIQHWADRLAALGYAALAVDLYGGTVATTRDEAMAAMKAVDEAQARATLAAAVQFLEEDPRVQAAALGVIGWCFGGGWALEAAIDNPAIDAAVIYYGHPETDPQRLAKIEGKVLGIFANQDQGIPPAKVDELERALGEAGVTAELHRYDAEHAFANPSGARYDQEAAAQAWQEVIEFLRATLGGGAAGPT